MNDQFRRYYKNTSAFCIQRITEWQLNLAYGMIDAVVKFVQFPMKKPQEIKTVDKFLIDGQKTTHLDFPCETCTGCSIALSKNRKDVVSVKFEVSVL